MTDEVEPMTVAAPLDCADGISESTDVRIERILEHVDDSLELEDALQATVGAASGDLMLMQYRLRQAMEEMLQQQPPSLAALAEVMPTMNTYTKISQQVDRYIQLSLKIRAAKSVS